MKTMRILRILAQLVFMLLFGAGSAMALDPGQKYYIKVNHSGKYLDVSGNSMADGAAIHQWTYHGGNNQKIRPYDAGNGYFYLKAESSGKYLDVSGLSQANGAIIHQWAYTGADNQKFKLIDAGGGYYYIQAKHSSKYLDISGGSAADGAKLTQYQYTGGNNQKFYLSAVPRTYYSDWGVSNPSGGYWVDEVKSVDYLSLMFAQGDSYLRNPKIQWLPACSGCVNLAWVVGRTNGKLSDGTDKVIPQGVIQVGYGDSNLDYILLGSVLERVVYSRSSGYLAPNSRGTASCQTAKANISQELWFASSTSSTVGESVKWDQTVKDSVKLSESAKAGVDFKGIGSFEATFTYEVAKEWANSRGGQLDNSWSDTETYTTKSVVGVSIPPGTVGSPAMTTPVTSLRGLFKFGRLYYKGGTTIQKMYWSDGNWRYRVHYNSDTTREAIGSSSPYWLGKLDVPTNYLAKIPGYTGAQNVNWYLHSPTMTVDQYKLYCQGDMAARSYAPAMKPALCAAGIDKTRTCS